MIAEHVVAFNGALKVLEVGADVTVRARWPLREKNHGPTKANAASSRLLSLPPHFGLALCLKNTVTSAAA